MLLLSGGTMVRRGNREDGRRWDVLPLSGAERLGSLLGKVVSPI